MDDWAKFVESVPWFLERNAVVTVTGSRKGAAIAKAAATLFPSLAELLARASVTDVSVDGKPFELVAWDSLQGDRMGWLCLPPSKAAPAELHEDYRILMASFGGIVERFNEPDDTWLLNLNDALTEREALHDASFIQDHYKWAFEDVGLNFPIDPTEYYSVAGEANGNITLCHRISGNILMFAPDHCFEHLQTLDGCPEYTLYTIEVREYISRVGQRCLARMVGPYLHDQLLSPTSRWVTSLSW